MTIREIDGGVCFLQASPPLFATAADRGGLFRPLLRGCGPRLSASEGPPLVMLLPLPPPAETDWFCRHPPSDPEMDPLDRETGKPACASGLHAPYPIPIGHGACTADGTAPQTGPFAATATLPRFPKPWVVVCNPSGALAHDV